MLQVFQWDKAFKGYVNQTKEEIQLEKVGYVAVCTWKLLLKSGAHNRDTDTFYIKNLGSEYNNRTLIELANDVFEEDLQWVKEKAFTLTGSWEEGIQGYYNWVELLCREHVIENTHDSMIANEVAEGVSGHLRWVKYDHRPHFKHRPMPLFLWSVIILTIEAFEHMLSWIYVYIFYAVQRPAAIAPKDILSAFLHMYSSASESDDIGREWSLYITIDNRCDQPN
ncbi:hypothetical protein BYT27DRAFT_7261670 [Phlegmacium glaucopus]|nr:hypothetical protein BYT27DRAFT_7261670 [Phlegmacium glaucopus]